MVMRRICPSPLASTSMRSAPAAADDAAFFQIFVERLRAAAHFLGLLDERSQVSKSFEHAGFSRTSTLAPNNSTPRCTSGRRRTSASNSALRWRADTTRLGPLSPVARLIRQFEHQPNPPPDDRFEGILELGGPIGTFARSLVGNYTSLQRSRPVGLAHELLRRLPALPSPPSYLPPSPRPASRAGRTFSGSNANRRRRSIRRHKLPGSGGESAAD